MGSLILARRPLEAVVKVVVAVVLAVVVEVDLAVPPEQRYCRLPVDA